MGGRAEYIGANAKPEQQNSEAQKHQRDEPVAETGRILRIIIVLLYWVCSFIGEGKCLVCFVYSFWLIEEAVAN